MHFEIEMKLFFVLGIRILIHFLLSGNWWEGLCYGCFSRVLMFDWARVLNVMYPFLEAGVVDERGSAARTAG